MNSNALIGLRQVQNHQSIRFATIRIHAGTCAHGGSVCCACDRVHASFERRNHCRPSGGPKGEKRADLERQSDLAAQRTALDQERERALAPYVQAAEAKNQIIEELNANFKDFDESAVEIDPETGKVKLHFQESYFALGSHELSGEMKSFLRAMIPRYAQSIYGNRDAAEQVESLNISGMASPIYQGVYIDINDTSPETQQAREYNMGLSNRRAEALYS